MVAPTAVLSLAALPAGVVWPLAAGLIAGVLACAAAAFAVITQRQATRRRDGPPPAP